MKLDIANKIRTFRKEAGLTQEQLAEALSVTSGAVYKWENALSVPDIEMIVKLADFFDSSVDFLLGYKIQKSSMEKTLERLKMLLRTRDFDTAIFEAEKALQKYPNCFDIIYECAVLYLIAGTARDNEAYGRRSLELYRLSLNFLSQNTDPGIGELSIKRDMALVYLNLNEADAAIDLLKKNNYDGVNDATIGFTLATMSGQPQESLSYLTNALISILKTLLQICPGFYSAYKQQGKTQEGIRILEWLITTLKGLRADSPVTYIDKLECNLLTAIADSYIEIGKPEKARESLRRSILLMRQFESSPNHSFGGIHFLQSTGTERAYDNLANNMEELHRAILTDTTNTDAISRLWEELINEDKDKK